MDPLKPNDKQTHSAKNLDKSLKQPSDVERNTRNASGDTPQSTIDKVKSDKEKSKMETPKRSSTSSETPKDKSVTELFPWLDEATEFNSKIIGSLPEVKPRQILKAMDHVIENLAADHDKYRKSPKISRALAGYLRRFLIAYRYLYKGLEKGKDYFQRISSLLATYTDLELLASVLGKELDSDVTNRIHLNYDIYLKYADETSILDVFMNVKRIIRLHGGILNPLLRHSLVKLSVSAPVEVSDDIYIKHLIVFKKWFGIANFSDERESIRRAFISQVKPQMSLGTNPTFAPYLPAEKETTTPTEHFVHLLDSKYSLEPLILAFKPTPSNCQPNLLAKKIREIVILSDDEEDDSEGCQLSKVKIEPIASTSTTILNTSNASSSSNNMIDLTDEVFGETDMPRYYISWLSSLVERAKAGAKTVDQRLQGASVSDDVIVIDDCEEGNNDKTETETETEIPIQHEPQNENECIELCASSTELIDSDATQTSNNQIDQNEQTNDRSKQTNNSNEQSTDSISLDVNQIDGVPLSTLTNIRTGSISNCNDTAAEQITNIDLGNGEVSEPRITIEKTVENAELTPFVEQMLVTKTTSNDSEIINDFFNYDLLTKETIPMPTIFIEPVMTEEENVLNEDLVKNTQIEQHLTLQSTIPDDYLTKYNQSNANNRINNAKQSTIKVLNSTRHNQWNDSNDSNESNPMNNEQEIPNTTPCSIPLAPIKTNPLLLRDSDEQIKRPEQSQQNDKIDIDSTNSDRNGKLILKSNQKMSPNPNTDRTISRLAQTSTNDTNNTSDNGVSLVVRRKVTEQIDNKNIPSTIMERKTYIKPVTVGIKSTNKSQQRKNGRRISSQSSSQASELINEPQEQQQQHKQTTSSRNAAVPPQTFKVFYSDEILPCLTPYDTIPAKYLKKFKRASKPARSPSPPKTHHLNERFAKCNITQESLAKAASQLVEICKNTSPIRNAVKTTASVAVERRCRRFSASTATTTTTTTTATTKQTTAAITKTTTEPLTKRSPATRMPMPNYIITKVTEKKRNNVNDGTKNSNQTSTIEPINKTNSIKSFREQHEIAKTNIFVESQRQKPLNVFNKCDSNSIIDNRANKVYSLNLNTRNKSFIETKLTHKNDVKPMGFHVTNVRTTIKNNPIQIGSNDIDGSQRSPTECKLIMNKSKNYETSGKKFRLVKVVEVKSIKSIPKAFTEKKAQTHLPNANCGNVIERKRSSSVPRTQSTPIVSYENPKKLVRRNSCYVDGSKINGLVEEAAAKNNDFAQLLDICSNVVLMSLPKMQTAKKRGRPKKPIYKSTAKDLLNSDEFSIEADLLKLNEQYCKEKNSFFDKLINFQLNAGLKKLSRIKTNNNNNNSSIVLLSISPQKSEQLTHFSNDHQYEEIGDLFESTFIDNDLDCANDLKIEYLSADIDEIKSPAYEPHIAVNVNDNSTNYLETTLQMNEFNRLNNDEQFHFVNEKMIEIIPDLYSPYLCQDSFVFDDVANEVTIEVTNPMNKTPNDDGSLSPIRKSSRKRKIPVAFVSPVKRTRR